MALADNKGKPYNLGMSVKKSREDYYRELLASAWDLGLEDKMRTQVGSLSGGQRQAVALLMATMTPIDMLILDEHTAALDPKTAEIIMELTGKIVAEKTSDHHDGHPQSPLCSGIWRPAFDDASGAGDS